MARFKNKIPKITPFYKMMAAVLESLIFLVIESTQLEYETYLLPHIR